VASPEEGWEGWPESWIQRHKLTAHLVADLPLLVTILDLKVDLQEIADGKVRGTLAIGDRAAFEQQPATGAMGPCELIEEAGLAYAGLPDHRHDLAVAGPSLFEGLVQGL
jgi:hypothetical protein